MIYARLCEGCLQAFKDEYPNDRNLGYIEDVDVTIVPESECDYTIKDGLFNYERRDIFAQHPKFKLEKQNEAQILKRFNIK